MHVCLLKLLILWSRNISQLAAWNANRANKVFSIYSWTEHLECSSASWFPSWTFLNHETVQQTKSSTIQRGLKGESSSTLTHKYTLWCMFFGVNQELKKKKKTHRVIFVAVYTFFKSLWAWHHLSLFHQSQRLFSQGGCLTFSRSVLLSLLKNLLSGVFKQEWLKYQTTVELKIL